MKVKTKKVFNYEFADGPRQLHSTVNVKCNITGEIIPFYHKFLVTLIEKKYENNYSLFESKFVKRGAAEAKRVEQGYSGDEFSLNAYSDYLLVCFRSCLVDIAKAFDEKTVVALRNQMVWYADCFRKHFNRDIRSLL